MHCINIVDKSIECPGRGQTVDGGTNKRSGSAALVERACERGIGESDVVPVEPGHGHRRLVGCLQQNGRLVEVSTRAEGTHQLAEGGVQVLSPGKDRAGASKNARSLDLRM